MHNTRSHDAYYTPPFLADRVISTVTTIPKLIMDPSVGDGALLAAAAREWPGAQLVGLDIDGEQIARLRNQQSDWQVGRMNMFSPRSRSASRVWKRIERKVDLALLNPPFSYRGGASIPARFDGMEFRLSPSAAFISLSLSRLTPDGQLLAVTPAGALNLEKDADFWSRVASRFDVQEIDQFSSTAFRGTRAKSALVSVKAGREQSRHNSTAVLRPAIPAGRTCVEIIRGRVPVHTLNQASEGERAPFVHTTDLAPDGRSFGSTRLAPRTLATQGPLLAIPRVGRLRDCQVRVLPHEESVLSDCLFGIRAETTEGLAAAERAILTHISDLRDSYSGPCAPYLTVGRLNAFLAGIGFCAHHVRAGAPPNFRCDPTLSGASMSVAMA